MHRDPFSNQFIFIWLSISAARILGAYNSNFEIELLRKDIADGPTIPTSQTGRSKLINSIDRFVGP